MMTAGWFLSLDNVLVALALAPLCVKAGRLWVLAAWFAGVEAVAPVVGVVLGGVVPPLAGPAGTMQVAVLLTLGLGVLGMGALTFFPLPLRVGVRGRGRWELATDRLSSLVRGPLPPTPSLKGRGSILHLRLHLNQHLHLHLRPNPHLHLHLHRRHPRLPRHRPPPCPVTYRPPPRAPAASTRPPSSPQARRRPSPAQVLFLPFAI